MMPHDTLAEMESRLRELLEERDRVAAEVAQLRVRVEVLRGERDLLLQNAAQQRLAKG
jgi:hypothetical protein